MVHPVRLIMGVPVRVLSMGQVDRFKTYTYSIGPCTKNILSNNTNKYERTINLIL